MSEEKVMAEQQAEESEVLTAEEEEVAVTEGEEVEQEQAPSLEQQLAAAQQELQELKDRFLRAAAENENFKKRMERERLAMLKYAGEHIFREILPVVDNLERAINQGVVDSAPAEQNLNGLLEGVNLTLKSLVSTLEKFEVKPIDSVGKEFDPKDQEALTMEASASIPANHVTAEFERGYYYKDRLLRAAKVIVSSGPPQE